MSDTLADLSPDDVAKEALEAGDQYLRHLFGQELIPSLAAHIRVGWSDSNAWLQTGELQIRRNSWDGLRLGAFSMDAALLLAELGEQAIVNPNTAAAQSLAYLFEESRAGGVIYLSGTPNPIICSVSAVCPGQFCVGAATVVAATYASLWREKLISASI